MPSSLISQYLLIFRLLLKMNSTTAMRRKESYTESFTSDAVDEASLPLSSPRKKQTNESRERNLTRLFIPCRHRSTPNHHICSVCLWLFLLSFQRFSFCWHSPNGVMFTCDGPLWMIFSSPTQSSIDALLSVFTTTHQLWMTRNLFSDYFLSSRKESTSKFNGN